MNTTNHSMFGFFWWR